MQVFQFEPEPVAPKKRRGILPIISGIALLAVVGTTLAANIGINTNDNNTVNFAQGITQAVSCDADGISLVPTSSDPQNISDNPAVVATWYLASVTLSGVSDACVGKTFTLAAYDTAEAGLQLAQVQDSSGANPVSSAVYDIAFTLSASNGWTATETGTKDYSVSGTYTNDDDNTAVIEFWFPNGNASLLTGWTNAVHNDAIGVESADLSYFTIETTE